LTCIPPLLLWLTLMLLLDVVTLTAIHFHLYPHYVTSLRFKVGAGRGAGTPSGSAVRGGAWDSFDDLVGTGEQRRRNSKADRLGGLEVEDKLVLRWLALPRTTREAIREGLEAAGATMGPRGIVSYVTQAALADFKNGIQLLSMITPRSADLHVTHASAPVTLEQLDEQLAQLNLPPMLIAAGGDPPQLMRICGL
jgi:hypothetical protein